MDQTASPFESSSEVIRPAEILPASPFSADQAARAAYADRGSYGAVLHNMFAEVDRNPEYYAWSPADNRDQQVFGRDTDAFREVLADVHQRLKSSDAVNAIRFHQRPIESEEDIVGCYRAYERALSAAMQRTPLSERQESKLKFAAHSELDWGLRELIMHHALESEQAAAPRYEPKDFLLILNPQLRRVEYMDSGEILSVLRRSGSLASRDRLQADLAVLRRAQRESVNQEEVQAALQTFEGDHH